MLFLLLLSKLREITECRYKYERKVCSDRMSGAGIYSLGLAAAFPIRGKVEYITFGGDVGGGKYAKDTHRFTFKITCELRK